MGAIVNNRNTLKGMAKAGFILWEDGYTTRHWTGVEVPVIFVREGPRLENWYDEFEYRGKRYRLRYFDGCFHPFVCEVGKELPEFV